MPGPILVVDDESANRALLEEILTSQGFTVVTACDGLAALDMFSRVHPDLVLLDVMMPRLNGLEVCRRLKYNRETRLTPVVLITSLAESGDRVRGIEAGADDFLNKPVDRIELLARVRSLLSLKAYTDELERSEAVLFALARAIEAKDPYTEGHCERLAEYSARLGEWIRLPKEQITALRRAGIVHDVGKVAVPDVILLKPGPLSEGERLVMQQHSVVGENICAPLKSFRLVLPIIRHHHEKLDGSGYPDGLRGEEIPISARILQIADVFDALLAKRPYKDALSLAKVWETMAGEVKRGWWDASLFAEFRRMLDSAEAESQRGETVLRKNPASYQSLYLSKLEQGPA